MLDLQEVFSQTSDAVFATDGTHRIVYQNKKFTDIFPRQRSNPPHRKCYEVLCGRGLDGKKFCHPGCPVGKSLVRGRSIESFDLAVPRATGESLWFSVGAIPASRAFDKAAAIFMLRPISTFRASPDSADHSDRKRTGNISVDSQDRLTRREQQILALLAKGFDARTVADTLHISYVTTRNHIQHIYEKLHVHNRAEAVGYAYRRGLPR